MSIFRRMMRELNQAMFCRKILIKLILLDKFIPCYYLSREMVFSLRNSIKSRNDEADNSPLHKSGGGKISRGGKKRGRETSRNENPRIVSGDVWKPTHNRAFKH